ncbi:MAG TPA: hypothetical protein VFS43_15955 [Polyangiaceae bacterium]|nr:hypothetical protein [Polyangiaceae bacterium]
MTADRRVGLNEQNTIYVKIILRTQEMWCALVVKCALGSARRARRTEPSIVNQDGGINLSAMPGMSPVVEEGGAAGAW